ncbi:MULTISPECIES: nitroreductase family protein [Shewanella]|uniref:Nitroreductase family protein n=1 Tax=Shewanella fidelis TaxID=173509 RepID=A0AAW8NLN6_9GAMM|nr:MULTISPECIES: nitroreductase family protein [Shewanella]MDR8524174.1 nitroreductase family protein [Shewanella fidelis]MDW4810721.1 nitroreductase family protein [Shewanella fidelis]MDW4814842.1 nitroreductase family protein [Shewanella fidelis]MDW4818932.1 nitroreductase family protein [Shewanella fidelis]MDW4823391.1 nitroreductase family protein [Shewanella fidelis]
MTHPIIADLESRYTAKRYDPSKRIPQQDLDVIYQAMNLSASSINSQPWKFIVIESDEAKQRMHDTFANNFQFNQPHIKAASHIVLFAHNPKYTREDYAKVVDKGIEDKRTKPEEREQAFGAYAFVELNTDENGDNSTWTKAQTYLALGNTLHVLARLGIDSTTMEGVDSALIGEIFKEELDGYVCGVALAMGYHHNSEDYNAALPKSRLPVEQVVQVL